PGFTLTRRNDASLPKKCAERGFFASDYLGVDYRRLDGSGLGNYLAADWTSGAGLLLPRSDACNHSALLQHLDSPTWPVSAYWPVHSGVEPYLQRGPGIPAGLRSAGDEFHDCRGIFRYPWGKLAFSLHAVHSGVPLRQ